MTFSACIPNALDDEAPQMESKFASWKATWNWKIYTITVNDLHVKRPPLTQPLSHLTQYIEDDNLLISPSGLIMWISMACEHFIANKKAFMSRNMYWFFVTHKNIKKDPVVRDWGWVGLYWYWYRYWHCISIQILFIAEFNIHLFFHFL